MLQAGKADAVVLLDQFFFRGELAPDVRCLYTDGEAWKKLHGFDELIKHMVAAREDLLRSIRASKTRCCELFAHRSPTARTHLEEIGDAFIDRYAGDKEALLASARYPRIEFTFTPAEQKLAQAEMELLFEVGQIPRTAPVSTLFAP